jgi:hypothetical protein
VYRRGPEPGLLPLESSVDADLGEASTNLGGQRVGERHELRGLIRSISEHVSLVSGSDLLDRALLVGSNDGLSNIGRLLLQSNDDVARAVVDTLLLGIIANLLQGVTDNLLLQKRDSGTGKRRKLAQVHFRTCGTLSWYTSLSSASFPVPFRASVCSSSSSSSSFSLHS